MSEFYESSYAETKPRSSVPMLKSQRDRIQRALDAVPDEEILGVLSFPVYPESCTQCLVCKLLDPNYGYATGDQEDAFAAKYGVSVDDAAGLYYGATSRTADVEDMIADRLDDIVFGKSVGRAA